MLLQKENTQASPTCAGDTMTNQATETSVYITDLLGELQAIAQIGGLTKLSDDIKVVLVRHVSGD